MSTEKSFVTNTLHKSMLRDIFNTHPMSNRILNLSYEQHTFLLGEVNLFFDLTQRLF